MTMKEGLPDTDVLLAGTFVGTGTVLIFGY